MGGAVGGGVAPGGGHPGVGLCRPGRPRPEVVPGPRNGGVDVSPGPQPRPVISDTGAARRSVRESASPANTFGLLPPGSLALVFDPLDFLIISASK